MEHSHDHPVFHALAVTAFEPQEQRWVADTDSMISQSSKYQLSGSLQKILLTTMELSKALTDIQNKNEYNFSILKIWSFKIGRNWKRRQNSVRILSEGDRYPLLRAKEMQDPIKWCNSLGRKCKLCEQTWNLWTARPSRATF